VELMSRGIEFKDQAGDRVPGCKIMLDILGADEAEDDDIGGDLLCLAGEIMDMATASESWPSVSSSSRIENVLLLSLCSDRKLLSYSLSCIDSEIAGTRLRAGAKIA
jgi:hypothetical protein